METIEVEEKSERIKLEYWFSHQHQISPLLLPLAWLLLGLSSIVSVLLYTKPISIINSILGICPQVLLIQQFLRTHRYHTAQATFLEEIIIVFLGETGNLYPNISHEIANLVYEKGWAVVV
jgi:hypothetical protein